MEMISRDISYKELLDVVYRKIKVDKKKFDIKLCTSLEGEGRVVHLDICDDNDLSSMKLAIRKVPIFYVTLVQLSDEQESIKYKSDEDDSDSDYEDDEVDEDEEDDTDEDDDDIDDIFQFVKSNVKGEDVDCEIGGVVGDDVGGDIGGEVGGESGCEVGGELGGKSSDNVKSQKLGGESSGNVNDEVGGGKSGVSGVDPHLNWNFNRSAPPNTTPNVDATNINDLSGKTFNIPGAKNFTLSMLEDVGASSNET